MLSKDEYHGYVGFQQCICFKYDTQLINTASLTHNEILREIMLYIFIQSRYLVIYTSNLIPLHRSIPIGLWLLLMEISISALIHQICDQICSCLLFTRGRGREREIKQ